MASVKVRDAAGAEKGSVDLDEGYFGIEPNVAVMHQVVTAQLAARRAGTQSTKTRAEVRGGGAKPWKQKGTGRARQGSIRSPQWKGGGVALGPKPRSYAQRTPKKMIRLALRSALSDRAAEGKVVVLDEWGFDAPSTKGAAALLGALGLEGRVVVVVAADEAVAIKSFRNLPEVHLLEPGELNAYDILVSDFVVFTKDNLPSSAAGDQAKPAKAPKTTSKAPKAAATSKAPKAATTGTAPSAAKVKPAATTSKASKATVVDAAAVAEPDDAGSEATGTSDAGGDTDMASDLPSRPKNTGEATKPVDPSERVKPAGDKADPRFEAARLKAEKEAEIRARQQSGARGEATDDAETGPADDTEAGDDAKPSGGFSFNQTVHNEGDES
jgi:large subunit ribosomal protein L4